MWNEHSNETNENDQDRSKRLIRATEAIGTLGPSRSQKEKNISPQIILVQEEKRMTSILKITVIGIVGFVAYSYFTQPTLYLPEDGPVPPKRKQTIDFTPNSKFDKIDPETYKPIEGLNPSCFEWFDTNFLDLN